MFELNLSLKQEGKRRKSREKFDQQNTETPAWHSECWIFSGDQVILKDLPDREGGMKERWRRDEGRKEG